MGGERAVDVPAQRAAALRCVLASDEALERLGAEEAAMIELALLEHRAGEA